MKLLYAYLFFATLFVVGCMTQTKVLNYIDRHQQVKDSITAKVLLDNPCNENPTLILQGSVDTSALMKYLLAIGCPIDTSNSSDYGIYIPTPNNETPMPNKATSPQLKQNLSHLIDSLRSHLHPDTVQLPPDPRLLKAMYLAVKMAQDSVTQLDKTIASLQQTVIDKDATIKDKNKWLWLFIAAIVAFCLSNAVWIYSKFKV